MLVIDSPRAKSLIGGGWLLFAAVNAALMWALPGKETIPYHLIWASFAFLYGLTRWSARTTWIVFAGITVVTGAPLIRHARQAVIGWEECSEIVLMGVIAALLVWHVKRNQLSQSRIEELLESEQVRARNRDLATRFGSHELRTRLTIARGFTDLIREQSRDPDVSNDASLALAELDKAATLATNLMTLVRVDATPEPQAVDLDELIDASMRRWAAQHERRWANTSTVGTIEGDAERLEAALDCLVENAVKFTERGDRISVWARVTGGDLLISVADSGAGIPPEDVPHVTDLFHICSNAGDRAGSGLGLPIVRAIAEARGGTLRVQSALGSGTTMTVQMPHGGAGARPASPADLRRGEQAVQARPGGQASPADRR
jgi:signal transduction histidine kinase